MKRSLFANKTNVVGWFFVLPFLCAFLVFAVYPLFYSFSLSLTEFGGFGRPRFVGGGNFKLLTRDKIFQRAVFNTFWIWITCFFFQVLIAMVLAGILTYSRIKGRQLWMSLFYFPNLVSAAVMALLFSNLFNTDFGVINMLLQKIGLISEPIIFLGKKWTARAVVSLIVWIQYYGVFVIYLCTAMNSISYEVYESAMVDGCRGWKAYFYITLPLMRPILYFIFITSVVGGMQIFEQPYLLTGRTGSPNNTVTTLMMYVFRSAFEYNRLGYASAIAVCTLVLILIGAGLISFVNRYLKNKYI